MQGQPDSDSLKEAGRSESERPGMHSQFAFTGKPSTGSPPDSWSTRDVKRRGNVKGRGEEVERLQKRIVGEEAKETDARIRLVPMREVCVE